MVDYVNLRTEVRNAAPHVRRKNSTPFPIAFRQVSVCICVVFTIMWALLHVYDLAKFH